MLNLFAFIVINFAFIPDARNITLAMMYICVRTKIKLYKQILDNILYRNTVLPYYTIRLILCQVHTRSLHYGLCEINIAILHYLCTTVLFAIQFTVLRSNTD